jgi:hypothetical protein
VSALYVIAAGVRFLMELCALGALGWWGARTGGTVPARAALAIGAPLTAAVVWALFCAPKATFALPKAPTLLLQALVFGSAAVALLALGRFTLAGVFVALVVVSAVVLQVLEGQPE